VFGGLTGTLPELPGRLGQLATAALAPGGPRVMRPHALSGADFRNAYTSAGNTRAGVANYTGHDRVHRLTVATIQFSGWQRSDLKTYAHKHHLPYSSATLTQVPAGQSSVPTKSDGGGAIEVALDQEALLSTAPYARQRAYFAPNTDAGAAAAYNKVYEDVMQGRAPHLVALSVSWGSCEGDTNNRTTINNILRSIVRKAHVTVFAASGDSGAYDCLGGLLGTTPEEGVDFPASSPYVVGVGGTRLTATKRSPNNGSNWHESAWSCASKSDCAGGGLVVIGGGSGGSGGGVSSEFKKPDFQSSVSASGRAVPDIAADADPASGFPVYSSQEGSGTVGGTSLATPVSAALFTDMLASRGFKRGIGDIHGRLYAAARHSGTFRDITSGSNGGYSAGAGYDAVTGLGAPLWPALGNRFFPGAKPSATATIKRHHPRSRTQWRTVTVHWGGHAPSGTKMVTAEVVVRQGNGSIVARRSGARPSGSLTFTGAAGHTYKVIVQAANSKHVMSAVATASLTVPRSR
ncbi:MAG TPA: S53 family peptidase, partial [Marmoricola sp.]